MEIIHYKQALTSNIHLDQRANVVNTKYRSTWGIGRETFGRVAVIHNSKGNTPATKIRYSMSYSHPAPGDKVFLSSESKIPRSLVRNTGYQITHDIDNADFVVVPYPDDPSPYNAQVFVKCTNGDFIICTVYDDRGSGRINNMTPEQLTVVEQDCKERWPECQVWAYPSDQYCFFMRDVPEHLDILDNTNVQSRKYKLDTELRLNASTDITPENLDLLRKMPDKTNALKLLMSSDFKKYPLTICMFLHNELGVDYGYKYGDQVNWMMKSIGYDRYDNGEELRNPVTPEDFRMLQDWILYNLKIKDTGLVPTSVMDELHSDYEEMLQTRVAVKRLELPGPMDLGTIKTMIANSK